MDTLKYEIPNEIDRNFFNHKNVGIMAYKNVRKPTFLFFILQYIVDSIGFRIGKSQ